MNNRKFKERKMKTKKDKDSITLDVTAIEPKYKHSAIFKILGELESGKSLIIENDHDPKPLYYQLTAENGNAFGWEYIENGPVKWAVKITKK
jgi:regulator of cell morphogenesis and NO signaling